MPPIKVLHVLSCSSEDSVHKAENMLVSDHYRRWKSAQPGEKQISLVLQLEKSSVIHSIDIGNEGSAFVEILVGRSSDSQPNYQVLLVTSSFMSPSESRQTSGQVNGINRVRMFGSDKLSQTVSKNKWDLVKIVCTQPFNKSVQYGLSFIVFHSPPQKNEADISSKTKQATLGSFKLKSPEESENQMSVGSLFAKRKSDSLEADPLTGPAVIRAAAADSKSDSDSNPIMPKKITKIIKEKSSLDKEVVSGASNSGTFSPTNTLLKESMNSMKSKSDILLKKSNDNNTSNKSSENSKFPNTSGKKNDPPFNQHRNGNIKQTTPSNRISPKAASINGTKTYSPASQSVSRKSAIESKKHRKVSKVKHSKPIHKILDHVVFVLSGYQNPQRGQIRDKAIEMGATYKPDWDKDCTHLICAFMNTPKFHQVQSKGGKIVKENWIIECSKERKLLPWKQFQLGKGHHPDSSESSGDSDCSDKSEPMVIQTVERHSSGKHSPSTSMGNSSHPSGARANNSFRVTEPDEPDSDEIFAAATDVESDSGCDTETEIARVEASNNLKSQQLSTHKMDTSHLHLPPLPDMFKDIRFLFYGDIPQKEKKYLVRYITGCSGQILEYMSDEVKYLLTYSKWIQDFTDVLKENKSVRIVKPQWIFECIEEGRFVPPSEFFVSKSGK